MGEGRVLNHQGLGHSVTGQAAPAQNPAACPAVFLRPPVAGDAQQFTAPARKTLRSGGFAKEGFFPRYLRIQGTWRDHERWAILADT